MSCHHPARYPVSHFADPNQTLEVEEKMGKGHSEPAFEENYGKKSVMSTNH